MSRYWYDCDTATYEATEKHMIQPSKGKHCHPQVWCDSCEALLEKEYLNAGVLCEEDKVDKLFRYKGVEYHVNDFVYMCSESRRDMPYDIGQILEISKYDIGKQTRLRKKWLVSHVKYRKFVRRDEVLPEPSQPVLGTPIDIPPVTDARLLMLTDEVKEVSVEWLEGKCEIKFRDDIEDLDAYKDRPDAFYFDSSFKKKSAEPREILTINPLNKCAKCDLDNNLKEQKQTAFLRQAEPLIALDIFSGCGGLTVGFEKTGVVKTKHAVEFFSSAAHTFK